MCELSPADEPDDLHAVAGQERPVGQVGAPDELPVHLDGDPLGRGADEAQELGDGGALRHLARLSVHGHFHGRDSTARRGAAARAVQPGTRDDAVRGGSGILRRVEAPGSELVLRRPRRRASTVCTAAALTWIAGWAFVADPPRRAGAAGLRPPLALNALGPRAAAGRVDLVVDDAGLRDGAGRPLCRWSEVQGAELEVQRAAPDDVYTERVELRGAAPLALLVSGLSLPPLEVHKAIRARLSASRGTTRPAAAARERAREHLRAGRVEDALAAFTEALRLDPDDAQSLHGRAGALQARGDVERAEADLNDAIRLEPHLAPAYVERAALRLRRGRAQLALEDVTRALELRPGDPAATALRAQAWGALEESQ